MIKLHILISFHGWCLIIDEVLRVDHDVCFVEARWPLDVFGVEAGLALV